MTVSIPAKQPNSKEMTMTRGNAKTTQLTVTVIPGLLLKLTKTKATKLEQWHEICHNFAGKLAVKKNRSTVSHHTWQEDTRDFVK